MTLLSDLLIILALIVANALFAGAEIAILTIRRSRLHEMKEHKVGGARSILALRERPERFLATVQVGITVVSVTAAAYGEESFARRLTSLLAPLGGYAEEVAFALVVAAISFLSIVLGELVPKSLALRHAETYAAWFARPMVLLSALARPLVWVLTGASNLVLRLFGERATFSETRLSREELRDLVAEAAKAGELDAPTGEIASRALTFGEVTVDELKVPIDEMVAMPRGAAVAEIKRILLEHGKSRMPVYDGTPDKIVGYVLAKDVLTLVWEPELIILSDLVRPLPWVQSSRKAVEVMRELQQRHAQLAIVKDDTGTAVGLVTIEDLVEELVGEILSEAEVERIRPMPDGTAVVQGTVPVREVNRALQCKLPEEERGVTMAGLVLRQHGWLPRPGAKVELGDGTVLEVVEATARRVISVRVRPAPATSTRSSDLE